MVRSVWVDGLLAESHDVIPIVKQITSPLRHRRRVLGTSTKKKRKGNRSPYLVSLVFFFPFLSSSNSLFNCGCLETSGEGVDATI